MWETLLKAVLTAGAVWCIAALSAKLARKSAALEQAEREEKEREQVDNVLDSVGHLPADDVRQRLQDCTRKK
ncbi:MAG: hypothetical protein ACI351_05875 [Candidatus Avelusimicrobium sp.]|uniref:hypothetical protein n=1 Tax=Candidatus Avelusimicrobium sp. TaxID=3048833 RepID=UPI003F093BD0